MIATILDGRATAQRLRAALRQDAQALRAAGVVPRLTVVLVGQHPASEVYVRNKTKAARACGIESEVRRLPEDTQLFTLLQVIDELNADSSVHGILVQLPLPAQIDTAAITQRISPAKDVDGFHPLNLGALISGQPGMQPCTPAGILALLQAYGIDLVGKHAVVIGRSAIVGRPLGLMLLNANATVTLCHRQTVDLKQYTCQADVLIAAIGQPNLVTAEMVKPGATVIDVGINRTDKGELCGDVDYAGVHTVASHITPVPGGVGPMTIALLLQNTIKAASNAAASPTQMSA